MSDVHIPGSPVYVSMTVPDRILIDRTHHTLKNWAKGHEMEGISTIEGKG